MKTVRFKRLSAACVLVCVCLVGLAACSSAPTAQTSSSAVGGAAVNTGLVAATVDGDEISEDEVTDFVESYRSANGFADEESWGSYLANSSMTPESFREEVIEYFVGEKLVTKAAEERNIEVTDEDVEEQIGIMKGYYSTDEEWQAALSSAGTTEEDYRDSVRHSIVEQKLQDAIVEETSKETTDDELLSYAQMYADYLSGTKRSSHILFKADDEATAKEVLEKLKAGTLDFEEAAKEYSEDGSGESGGDVGWDMLNSFVTEYTDALAELDKGEMSDLVESEFGYHIIKCTDVFEAPEGGVTSLDQVPEDILDYLRNMMEQSADSTAVSEWYTKYREEADVVINPMPEGLPYDVDVSKYATGSTGTPVTEDLVVEEEAASSEVAESSDSASSTAEESSSASASASSSAADSSSESDSSDATSSAAASSAA